MSTIEDQMHVISLYKILVPVITISNGGNLRRRNCEMATDDVSGVM